MNEKVKITITVDDDLLAWARTRSLNISGFCNSALKKEREEYERGKVK